MSAFITAILTTITPWKETVGPKKLKIFTIPVLYEAHPTTIMVIPFSYPTDLIADTFESIALRKTSFF